MQGLMPSLGKGAFLSEDMFGGTLQGEVDQNTVAILALLPWLLQFLLLDF